MVNEYKKWNNALWHYFFPDEESNPILYLDSTILSEIGQGAHIRCDGQNWEYDFLSKTLIPEDKFQRFRADWRTIIGRPCASHRWDELVVFLRNESFDGIPAYFAMICAIMYLACTCGAKHRSIKDGARNYLGEKYRGHVGELIDDLLWALFCDRPSFRFDDMICGTQRNMGRIRFHTILRPAEKADFIDFIEVNNLKWEYESYSDFINLRLIPALNSANKRNFIELVTSEEKIPYVKGLLQSSNLNFGKNASDYNNIRQPIEIKWYYELYIDQEGTASFYIPASPTLPFSVMLRDGAFAIDQNSSYSDFIAADVPFSLIGDTTIEENGYIYQLHNIANDERQIYFERVGYKAYRQTTLLQDGHDYLMFISNNRRNIERLTEGWTRSEKSIAADGYVIFEISNYNTGNQPARRRAERDKLEDTYSLNGIGTWFGIYLKENQQIYWKPDWVNEDETAPEFTRIEHLTGQNGKCYFNLSHPNRQQLSGHIIIVSDNNIEQPNLSEHIVADLFWSGNRTKYHIDGWGEITENLQIPNPPVVKLSRHYVQGNAQSTRQTNVLVQVLYDIADENGCVNSKDLVKALDFVMEMFDIIPTPENRRNVIYALKRLGYMVSYNTGRRSYINQLNSAYLELTNYEISTTIGNAYLVKGVYSSESINRLANAARTIVYRRPYEEQLETIYPEFKILPDAILVRTDDTLDWNVRMQPIAYEFIDMMEDMGSFSDHYRIQDRGDIDPTIQPRPVPFIIKDNYGEDVLYTMRGANYIKHKTFQNAMGSMELIPKHLMRAYCQNENDQPVCIFEMQRAIGRGTDQDQNIIFSTITFASGMARPQILDIALCDLNLGLPTSEYLFIVNQDTVGIPSNYSFLEGRSYSTDATPVGHRFLKQAIEKLSNRTIDHFSHSSAILVCVNRDQLIRRNMPFSMKLINNSNDFSFSLILNHGDQTIAFSYRRTVYAYNPNTQRYYEIIGDCSINQKLSNIIVGIAQEYGQEFQSPIPDFGDENAKQVRIVKSINL